MFLLLLIFCSRTTADFFVDYTNKFLDQDISPCQNFYLHVCPVKHRGRFYTAVKKREITKLIEQHMPNEEISLFENEILANFKKTSIFKRKLSYSEHKEEFLRKLCGKGRRKILHFLERFSIREDSNSNTNLNCSTIADKVANHFYNNARNNENVPDVTDFFGNLIQTVAYNRYLKENESLMSIINKRIKNIIEILKSLFVKKLQETPWVQEKGLGDFFTNSILSIGYTQFEYNGIHEQALTKSRKYFSECVQELFEITGGRKSDVLYCLRFASAETQLSEIERKRMEEEQKYIRENGVLDWNVFFDVRKNYIITLPAALLGEYATNQYSFVGSIGFILAHELSHFLFSREKMKSVLFPSSSVTNYTRLKTNLCERQEDSSCQDYTRTIYEDAADWLGIQLAKEITDFTKGSTPGNTALSKNQLFFYAVATTFCDTLDKKDFGHTTANVRVNNLLMITHDFSKTFQCATEDRMYVQTNPHAYIL